MAITEQTITRYFSDQTGMAYDTRQEAADAEFKLMLSVAITTTYGSYADPGDVLDYILTNYKLEKK